MHRIFHIFIAALSLLVLLGGCKGKVENEKIEELKRVVGVYHGVLDSKVATLEVYLKDAHLRLRGKERWGGVDLKSSDVNTFTGVFHPYYVDKDGDRHQGEEVLLICEFTPSEKKIRVYERGEGAVVGNEFVGIRR